jgi:hypothetical protein
MNILLTLDSGMGANLGPNFNLTSNSGHTVTPNTATRSELIAGKSITVSPDGATNIFVTSTGDCTNTLVLSIAGITTSTTTSTTSTSTTAAPTTSTTSTSTTSTSTSTSTTTLAAIPVTLAYSNVDGPTACYKFTAPIPDTSTYYLQPGDTLADGEALYADAVYSNVVADGFYSNGVDYWEVSSSTGSVLTNGTPCPQTTTTTTSTSTTSTSTSTTSTSTSTSTTTTEAPTTTTSSTTSTTTVPLPPGETSTTTTSTTAAPTSTTTTTTEPPTTTTTTEPPTTTSTTSTTTSAYYSFGLGVDSISGNGACIDYASAPITYYAAVSTLANTVVLYQDSALSTFAPNNYYSDGTNSWLISSNGILTSQTLCSGTTTSTTTASGTVDITITNSSLDVPIGSMTINGVNVDWVGYGPDFVLSASDNGSFTSTQTGTQDVVIGYGGHIPGQRITFYDSNNFATCQTLNGSVGTFTITGATITAGTTISVVVEDGICP